MIDVNSEVGGKTISTLRFGYNKIEVNSEVRNKMVGVNPEVEFIDISSGVGR